MDDNNSENREISITNRIQRLTLYDEHVLDEFEQFMEHKYGETAIPLSIFQAPITPFEALCIFLVEHKKQSFAQIAKLLHRDRRAIWKTYKRARDHFKDDLEINWTQVIEIDSLVNEKLTVAESLVLALSKKGMENHVIAKLLGKHRKTVWTWLHRAKKKRGDLK